jgi:hypothetical protein
MKAKVSWTIDEEIVESLDGMAEKQGIPTSQLVNTVLKAGLESTGDLVKALDGINITSLLEILMKEGKKKKKK